MVGSKQWFLGKVIFSSNRRVLKENDLLVGVTQCTCDALCNSFIKIVGSPRTDRCGTSCLTHSLLLV